MHVSWTQLFTLTLPWMEIIVRGSATYWFLFLVFRFIVRRGIGSVGIADILLLVIVADASQNAMAGGYKSVSDGFVLIGTLIFWSVLLDWLSFRFPGFRRFAESRAMCLVLDGRMVKRNMRREFITEEEVWQKLREEGIESMDQVRKVLLEPDGEFSVIRK